MLQSVTDSCLTEALIEDLNPDTLYRCDLEKIFYYTTMSLWLYIVIDAYICYRL